MQNKFCQVSNGAIHYLEGGRGKTIILLPGTAITSKSLEEIGVLLSEHLHIIIPDLFKGKSTFSTLAYSFKEYSDALHEFVIQLGIKQFSLIGWSIGGLIVSAYAQKYPQNLHRLIFLNTSTMHLAFMEKPGVVLKGYLRLGFHSLFSLKGIKIVSLWVLDIFQNAARHPSQFIKEIQTGMYDELRKSSSMPVPSKLFISKHDEYVSPEVLYEANQNIKKLAIEIVNGRHDWFYHNKKLFLEEVKDFLLD